MAPKKKGRVPEDGKRYGPKPEKSSWVRTAGATGDDSFDRIEEFQRNGCGVSEEETDVGSMPNEGIELSQLPGRTR